MLSLCAVFIDFENLYYYFFNQRKDLQPSDESLNVLERLRAELQNRSLRILLGRAYGDFDRLPSVQGPLQLMGFEPRFTLASPHKGSSDIALSLDALEVLLTREEVSTFVIMAGDRDYLPIIRRIRERAKEVLVVGFDRNTSADLKNVVGTAGFIKADEFVPPPPQPKPEELAEESAGAAQASSRMAEEELICIRLLLEAHNTFKSAEIWLSPFMQNYMNQSFGQLDRLGRRRLIERIEALGLLKVEKRQGNPYDYSVIVLNAEAAAKVLEAAGWEVPGRDALLKESASTPREGSARDALKSEGTPVSSVPAQLGVPAPVSVPAQVSVPVSGSNTLPSPSRTSLFQLTPTED